jgi:hypothetical protein
MFSGTHKLAVEPRMIHLPCSQVFIVDRGAATFHPTLGVGSSWNGLQPLLDGGSHQHLYSGVGLHLGPQRLLLHSAPEVGQRCQLGLSDDTSAFFTEDTIGQLHACARGAVMPTPPPGYPGGNRQKGRGRLLLCALTTETSRMAVASFFAASCRLAAPACSCTPGGAL